MSIVPLTPVQTATLAYIASFIEQHKYPPTIRDIAIHFRVGTNAVWDRLAALERRGCISRARGVSRGIRVLP